jgi:hypothetical protein
MSEPQGNVRQHHIQEMVEKFFDAVDRAIENQERMTKGTYKLNAEPMPEEEWREVHIDNAKIVARRSKNNV